MPNPRNDYGIVKRKSLSKRQWIIGPGRYSRPYVSHELASYGGGQAVERAKYSDVASWDSRLPRRSATQMSRVI